MFEPVKSDILAAGVQYHCQLTQKGKKGTIQSFLMMMKWLRVEHSPIVAIFVVNTYFVTLVRDAVSMSDELYIHTALHKRVFLRLRRISDLSFISPYSI